MSNKGYHKIDIMKHSYTSPFKLVEESLEFVDAIAQGNRIMASVELSDLFGAIKRQARLLNLTIEDLDKMSSTTERVLENKRRSNVSLYDYLKDNNSDILEFGLGFIQVKIQNVNYNFYTDKVSKFTDHESPHSHQQDFISEIICGELKEKLYSVRSGDMKAFCGCGDTDKVVEDTYSYEENQSLTYKVGDLYVRCKEDFHTVEAINNTVTKVVKCGNKVDAIVIGEKKDYIRSMSEDSLWNIVKEICKENEL